MNSSERRGGRVRILVTMAVVLAFLLSASAGLAARGAASDLRFRVVAQSGAEDLAEPVIRVGGVEVSREEFLFYLDQFLSLPALGDLLQRNYLWHYGLAEKLARSYPVAVEDVAWRAIRADATKLDNRETLTDWVVGQADLFARFVALSETTEPTRTGQIAMDVYADHLYAQRLMEVVQRGEMEATREGVVAFITSLSLAKRENIDAVLRPTDEIQPFEEDEIESRVRDYQRDLAKVMTITREYEAITTLNTLLGAPATVLATLNGEPITFEQFAAVHGRPKNDVDWNNIKGTRVGQLIASKALAAEAHALKLDTPQLRNRVSLAGTFYRAINAAVVAYRPEAAGEGFNVGVFQVLNERTSFRYFRKSFIRFSAEAPGMKNLWIDEGFLRSVEWDLAPVESLQVRALAMPRGAFSPTSVNTGTSPGDFRQ
jgi:hypothetical protein